MLTIQGLSQDGRLHPLPEAFPKRHAFQCGFRTPAMILKANSVGALVRHYHAEPAAPPAGLPRQVTASGL